MRTRWIGVLLAALTATSLGMGCSTMQASGDGPTSAEPGDAAAREGTASEEDTAARKESLVHKLTVAKIRLDHANLERKMHTEGSKTSVALAQEELELGKGRLAQFKEIDMPNRIAQSELNLQRMRDNATEAEEELKQIELMYEEQDLEDRTREFVINRGKRNAERVRRTLAIQEREHESLTKGELPRELREMELDVARKKDAVWKAEIGAKAGLLMKEIAVMDAEAKIVELERELKELEEKGTAQ